MEGSLKEGADCFDLKNKTESRQENKRKVQKDKSNVRCFKCKKMGHCATKCTSQKDSSGSDKHVTFAMICYENNEEEKMRMGKKKISKNQ